MNEHYESPTNVAKLRRIYASSEQNRWILDDFRARERRSNETTVDATLSQLLKGGRSVKRSELIELFKKLADAGCGEFKRGRRGAKTRIEWKEDLMRVGRIASGQDQPHSSEPSSDPGERPPLDASVNPAGGGFIFYPFQLRDNVTVTLRLPKDLRQFEAIRLGEYLKAIAMPDVTGGAS